MFFLFFVDSQLSTHVRQDETPCACHQKERKKKKASTSMSTKDGTTQKRGGGLPPLRTMCAKHWPQKGKRGGGLGMRCWYEYTFKHLMVMDASPFLGWPVCGSSAAHQAKSCKSASLVVTKTGGAPCIAWAWLEVVTWGLIVGWQRREGKKKMGNRHRLPKCCLYALFVQSTHSQHTVNIQSTYSQHTVNINRNRCF
jgi:hypothetical protein